MTTYYVSTTGNDSNLGTLVSPWKTIQKAANTMVAGDTVYVRGGTYYEQVIVKNSGSPSKYISFIAYPRENPIIDGTGVAIDGSNPGLFNTHDGKLSSSSSNAYILLQGFTLTNNIGNPGYFGIWIWQSSHVIIRNNTITKIASTGLKLNQNINRRNGYFPGDEDFIIEGNTFDQINIVIDPSTGVSGDEELDIVATSNFVIRNNTLLRDTKDGLTVLGSSAYGKIYGNYINNGDPSTGAGIAVGASRETDYVHDIDVYQNYVAGVAVGIYVATEGGGTVTNGVYSEGVENVKIYNNIVTNTTNAFQVRPQPSGITIKKNIYIINNVAYRNLNLGFQIEQGTNGDVLQNVVVRNNIASQNKNQIYLIGVTGGVIVDTNLIDGPTDNYGTNYITGDPQFVNPLSSPPDFHLKSTSPAIDTGSSLLAPSFDFDNNLRPQGAGYDIGAYEYISGILCPPGASVSMIVT